MWVFYVVDRLDEVAYRALDGRVKEMRVYSAATFPAKEIAERRAKEVSTLMGDVSWGVEEIRMGE